MTGCANCGAPDQVGRFCTDCGNPLATSPTSLVSLEKPRPVGPAEPTQLGPARPVAPPTATYSATSPTASYPAPPQTGSYPAGPPTGSYPASANTGGYPPPGAYPPPPGPPGAYLAPPGPTSPGRRRGTVALVVLAVAVLLLAAVGVWFTMRPTGGDASTTATALPPTVATSTAAGSSAAGSGAGSADAPARPAPVGPGGGKGDPGASSAAPTTVTTVATTTLAPNPMGGDRADLVCGTGYIVQIASELDQATFQSRVATLYAAGTLPAGARWTETSAGCSLFTNQANVYVLYAGPFALADQACPDRLASPPDAFIKSTDPATVGSFQSCLCTGAARPDITAVGQQNVWVGELQRVLDAGLGYDVGAINADPAAGDPGRWGTYTEGTAAAVSRYQADQGLPVTGRVDAATWASLQNARCGHE